jgi:hypothetical protein
MKLRLGRDSETGETGFTINCSKFTCGLSTHGAFLILWKGSAVRYINCFYWCRCGRLTEAS